MQLPSALILSLSLGGAAMAAEPQTIHVDANGTIHADGITAPLSEYVSEAVRARRAARLVVPPAANVTAATLMPARAGTDAAMQASLARWLAIAPARITPLRMSGVQTDVVTPQTGISAANKRRILINLHGGGFFAGARFGGQVEAVPLATMGRIKVVTIDYRMAPEAHFPAASQDVAAVYRHLLKSYPARNIGIYGCSAGGTLVGQSLAWFQSHGLPRPGAAGIFCSGLLPSFWYGGDSMTTSQLLNARVAATPEQLRENAGNLYLAGTDRANPLVTPGLYKDVLAKFPPTLILSSTRDSALSNALASNQRLLEAGAQTQLLVLEGTGHGEFNHLPGTPEANFAFRQIWRFFNRHLGR